MSLKAAAISGAKWTTASTVAVSSIQLLQLVVLARVLSPSDFGIMAMAMAALGFAQIFTDAGISNAIIHRQTNSRQELSSLYWLNVFAGVIVFCLALVATPLLVSFFGDTRLGLLFPCTALVFLIAPFGLQPQLLLQRDLQFKRLALIEASSAAVGAAVAIASAYAGYGVYALVFAQLAGTLFTAIVVTAVTWRESRPLARYRTADVRPYLRFGVFQLGDRAVNYLVARADQIVIGSVVGAYGLGLYNFAWNLAIMPVNRINPILTRIAFPVFAKVQQENERLKRGYLLLVWLLAMVNAPILLGGAAAAGMLVPLFFGPQWASAVPILQILAVVGLSRALLNPIGSLVLAKGRPDLAFRLNVCFLFLQIPAVYLGARIGGIESVAWTVLILQLADMTTVYLVLMRPLLGPCLSEYVRSLAVPLATAFTMAIIVAFVPLMVRASPLITLGAQVVAGVAFYLIANVALQGLRLRAALCDLRLSRS
jgi:O-antigen/teichoic acid export membrane protein